MANKAFVDFTRVYRLKGKTSLKNQTLTVAKDAIASVRASNRLGHPDHRTTITMKDGTEWDLADMFSDVKRAVGA